MPLQMRATSRLLLSCRSRRLLRCSEDCLESRGYFDKTSVCRGSRSILAALMRSRHPLVIGGMGAADGRLRVVNRTPCAVNLHCISRGHFFCRGAEKIDGTRLASLARS
jgi:hypothetical protein